LLDTKHGPLDLLGTIGKARTYEDLIPFSDQISLGSKRVNVLGLKKLIEMKEEAGREKDLAVLPLLRRTLEEKQKKAELDQRQPP
jgi:predicted nucleotidyltransferase